MDYAFAETKNPALAWNQVHANSLKKQKQTKSFVHDNVAKAKKFNIRKTFGALAEILKESLLITVLCFGLFQGYLFLTTSPYFQISNVAIGGNRILDQAQLLRWIGPVQGKNIFNLNPQELARKLGEHPWIRGVSVERKFPDSIRIHLEERTPYARIQLDRVYIMDNYGVLMAEETMEYRDLPLIKGIVNQKTKLGQKLATEDLLPGLQIIHYMNRLPFFQADPIETVEIKDNHRAMFATRERKTKIVMNLRTTTEGFENFKIVADLIRPENKTYEYIDLSIKDKVVVKAADSGGNPAKQAKSHNTGGG